MTTSNSPVRFVDGARILMSDGWVVRAAARPELVPLMPPLPRAVCKTTTLTPRARSCCKTRPRARASSCNSKLAARRAKQRWSALVSASTSRLARAMRGRLGDAHWATFMRHVNRQYKAAFVKAFAGQPVLRCVGPVGGGGCPDAFAVDLDAPDAKAKLESLHLDHERPVHLTCARWSAQLPERPQSWDDGIDGGALCHALFGVADDDAHGACCMNFRCGARRN